MLSSPWLLLLLSYLLPTYPAPFPPNSRNLLQFSLNYGRCAIELGSHVDGVPVDDEIRKARGYSDCCSLCDKHPVCNAYTYCSRKTGCQDEGINDGVVDYQTCILKYQFDVAEGNEAIFLLKDFQSDFGSGYILGKKTERQTTGLQRSISLHLAAQNGFEVSDCTDEPPVRGFTCQQQKEWGKCTEAWMIREDYCAFSCGRCASLQPAQECNFIDNFHAKGSLILNELRYATNAQQCCRMCSDDENCNVFVYCGREEGCRNQGRQGEVMKYTRCDLKYQDVVAQGGEPEEWFSGLGTDFTSGYLSGKGAGLLPVVKSVEDEARISMTILFAPSPSPSPSPLPSTTSSMYFPALIASKTGQCMVQFDHFAKGDTLLSLPSEADNVGQCCRKCQENNNCNVFVFCNSKSGCKTDEYDLNFKYCELKYEFGVVQKGEPQGWKLGSNVNLYDGLVTGFVVVRS